ncbi:MAG TPA: amidohydrolase family protein [Bacteroidota bacterium]
MRTLLKNCFLVTLDPPFAGKGDLRIDGGSVAERGDALQAIRGEETIDLGGKVVIPGMVCAHTHLYSSLARGMNPPKRKPQNFLQVLRRLWWKLDRALDDESVYYSALAGGLESLKCGTTLLFDHHSSPNAIEGSLGIIKEALADVGLRGVLCYEVTDRGGRKERDAGLEENRRFLAATEGDSRFRGLVGAHASFTLGKASLEACGELAAAYRTGVHIHVAEDECDVRDARRRSGAGLIRRLEGAGIVRDGSVFAHCVHLRPAEFHALGKGGPWLVHNPRSNMNNGVGHAPVQLFPGRSALGTDGFPADMFEEARSGFFRAQEDPGAGGGRITGMVAGGWKLAASMFGVPFGSLSRGAVADLAVLDYEPPTPVHTANIAGHFLFGFGSSSVESVMVGGKWVLRDRRHPMIDDESVMKKAREVTGRLWNKLN